MADVTSLATLSDYETRYGDVDVSDEPRVGALLEDASILVLSMLSDETRLGDELWLASARAVVCAMVKRASDVTEDVYGVTQASQTAGPYTLSTTYANPSGDLYLSKWDLRQLGLGGVAIGSIRPMVGSDHGDEDACD